MNIKDSIIKIIYQLKNIDSKEFNKYLYGGIGAVVLGVCFIHYTIYSRSILLRKKIITLHGLSKQTKKLVEEFGFLAEEEKRLHDAFVKHGCFQIKIYFEQLCKDKNLNSFLQKNGWDFKIQELDEKIVEESVSANFQGMTTQNLVNLLEEIEKQELLYVKHLRIRPDKDKKITFDFTIATIKNK